jgi:hypothetical protein
MKYILSENRIEKVIFEYFDKTYDLSDINYTNPYTYDDRTGEEYEDPNIITFYKGDYQGPYDSEFIFVWVDKYYYDDDEPSFNYAPILEVHEDQSKVFDAYFGDLWLKPMKKWFNENFKLPVNILRKRITF